MKTIITTLFALSILGSVAASADNPGDEEKFGSSYWWAEQDSNRN